MRARRSARAGGRGRTGFGTSAGEPARARRDLRKTGMVLDLGSRCNRCAAFRAAPLGGERPRLSGERPKIDGDGERASAKGGQHLLGEETGAAEILHAPEEADEVRDP